jgi:hypothetical protein
MTKSKNDLVKEYSEKMTLDIISFARDYTGEDLELDPNRDLPVFKSEMKKYLLQFLKEIEDNG